jgi:membrane-associated phospholipid phosphatase
MKYCSRLWLSWLMCFVLLSPTIHAQEADSLKPFEDPPLEIPQKEPFYKSKIFKATIAPAILIGYGISTIKDNGIYSSYDAREDILRNNPNFNSWVDDALLIAPYVELAIVNLLKVQSNNDFLNTSLLILKAESMFAISVLALKHTTKLERPNGEDTESMPSAHTAQAFLAATIVNAELRHKSPLYGIGAYGIATTVGAFRMLKNKHWQSDVFVGAGLGILCANVAYLTHRNRWGRKPFAMTPTYNYGATGVGITINIDEFYKRKQISPEYQAKLTFP